MEEQLVLNGNELTVEQLVHAGKHKEVVVSIDDKCWPAVDASANLTQKLAAEGQIIYGVTTNCGGFVCKLLPLPRIAEFQNNLIRSVQTQAGEPLPEHIVRMAMIARANSVARGISGLSKKNAEIYLQMINKHIFPIVPRQGSLGTSGDLGPLACIALVAIGEWKASYNGSVVPGRQAMEEAGIPLMILAAKEGLALINGTSVMLSVACDVLTQAEMLMKSADVTAAMSFEALQGKRAPFSDIVMKQRPHPGQLATAKNITMLVEDSTLVCNDNEISDALTALRRASTDPSASLKYPIAIEDAYSIRCHPQYVGPAKDMVNNARKTLTIELNSTQDNPIVVPEANTPGKADGFFHCGHFHGQPISVAMDCICMASTMIAVIAERRIDRLMKGSAGNSCGLPDSLAVGEDLPVRLGHMTIQFNAANLVAKCRSSCIPVSIQSIPTTLDFQDIVSFGLVAGLKALETVADARRVVAAELLCARQGVYIRQMMQEQQEQDPLADPKARIMKPSRAALAVAAACEKATGLGMFVRDMPMTEPLDTLNRLIQDGTILEAAETALGKQLLMTVE